jgi:hypothetical protein
LQEAMMLPDVAAPNEEECRFRHSRSRAWRPAVRLAAVGLLSLLPVVVPNAAAQTDAVEGGYAVAGAGAVRWSATSGPPDCVSEVVYGYTTRDACTTGWADRNSVGGRIGAGWRFNPWLAAEAVYAYLGEASVGRAYRYYGVVPNPPPDPPGFTMPSSASGPGEYRLQGAELTAVAFLPIVEKLSLFARAGGYAYWQHYSESTTGPHSSGSNWSASDSGFAPVFGAGLDWRATPTLGLRVEWIRYQHAGKLYGGWGTLIGGWHGDESGVGRFDIDTAWFSLVVAFPR